MSKLRLLLILIFSINNLVAEEKESDILSAKLKNINKDNRELKKIVKTKTQITKQEHINKRLRLELKCQNNDIESCFKLANLLVKNKKKRLALKYWNKACDHDYAKGCYNLGKYHEKSFKKAFPYYSKACNLKMPEACNNIGALAYSRKQVPKAKQFFKQACQLDLSSGCFNYGKTLEKDKKIIEAYQYINKACTQKNTVACKYLFNKKNIMGQECVEPDATACIKLGQIYLGLNDIKKAKYYINVACEHSSSVGCYNLGLLFLKMNNKRMAFQKFQLACRNNDVIACRYSFVIRGRAPDKLQGFKIMENSCMKCDSIACTHLILLFHIFGNTKESKRFVEKNLKCGHEISLFMQELLKLKKSDRK